MISLGNIACIFILFLSAPALAQDALSQLRYLSLVFRDHAPTPAEAKTFAAATDKQALLADFVKTWMATPDFDARLRRHFHDMFGIEQTFFVAFSEFDLHRSGDEFAEEAPPDLVETGTYYLKSSVKPTCGTPVNASAWWTTETIRICPSAVSTALSQNGSPCSDPFGAEGILNAACGCGPNQVLCWPKSSRGKLQVGFVNEFAERGLYAYKEEKSWEDLLGGDLYIGNKWLYHHYVYQQRIGASLLEPTAAQLALMRTLPDDGIGVATFPPDGGPVRSGLATMPAFLSRFNNFRSRIRALTEQLLCQDIDSSLNTSGISTFVNPDLTDFDRSHGDKESCSSCHYAMDNMGSTLLGWSDGGTYEPGLPRSQLGHVFGTEGTGPRFLMHQYVNRGDPFIQCMARKTWENFSGADWSALTTDQKNSFLSAATEGPRQVIRAVLLSNAMLEQRAANDTVTTKKVNMTYDFNADVNPIIKASCSGNDCHGAGGTGGQFTDNAPGFNGADAVRIQNGSMPPVGSGMSLSAADRDILLLYLSQD